MQSWFETLLKKLRQMDRKGVVLKGYGMERNGSGVTVTGRNVNFRHRTVASGRSQKCQEPVDTKAFKGRGNRHDLRQLRAEVDRLEQHMAGLATASKQVHGGQMYLMLHQRTATGYVFLRWREAGGFKRHLSWDAARDIYMAYTEQMRSWYIQITDMAVQANTAHTQLRKEMRVLHQRLLVTQTPVFARPVPG